MSRRTKTLMPMVEHRLFPDSSGQEADIRDRQLKQKKQEEYCNKTSKDLPELKAGDEVWVKPHTLGQKNGKKQLLLLNVLNLDHLIREVFAVLGKVTRLCERPYCSYKVFDRLILSLIPFVEIMSFEQDVFSCQTELFK